MALDIIEYKNEFRAYIGFDSYFSRNVAAIKAIEGAKFIYREKFWTIPVQMKDEVYDLERTHRADITKADESQQEATGEIPPLPGLSIPLDLPEGVELRTYQKQGVQRVVDFQRILIGDEPGLGKTIQSIASIVGIGKFPILVICPASLKENWKIEIEKFSHLKAMILNDKVKSTWYRYYEMGLVDVFIVNYESLKKYFVSKMPSSKKGMSKEIIMHPSVDILKGIIIDESHRCKNTSTIQTKLCLRIAQGKEVRILLTGTPVVNKPTDLFPQLAIMGRHGHFGSTIKNFKVRYCNGGNGASNLSELNYLLNKHCYFRREKKDVLADLPDKERQTIVCEIDNRSEYEKAEKEFVTYLKEFKHCSESEVRRKLRGEIMVKLGILRGISARGKMSAIKEFTEEILESGEKLILFCNLKEIVHGFVDMFPDTLVFNGEVSTEDRQKAVEQFQNDPTKKLIICNIKAAGVGITLTASSRVAFIEFPWTYADCVQCEDRAHRIGQKDSVTCTYFLGRNTVDQKMYDLIQKKKEVANTISGANDTTQNTFIDDLSTLFTNQPVQQSLIDG